MGALAVLVQFVDVCHGDIGSQRSFRGCGSNGQSGKRSAALQKLSSTGSFRIHMALLCDLREWYHSTDALQRKVSSCDSLIWHLCELCALCVEGFACDEDAQTGNT